MSPLREACCAVWCLVLAAVVLGPALGPGYLLTYDMVWVPDLALGRDALGLGSSLPRAVPSDAVVAVLDEVVPGQLLQKGLLLGALAAGGTGASRLVPDVMPARLATAGLYVWNPLVAERLVIGHWPVLVGYAVLPWVVLAARDWRADDRMPRRLLVLLPLGALSASAGLATAAVLLAFAAGRRRWAALVGLLLAANAPWLVAGLVRGGTAATDPAGATVFALHDEGTLPGPVAALTLGGIWNSEVVPASREGLLAWLATVVLVGLALAGVRHWWRRAEGRERTAYLLCWALGWGLAVGSWAAPDAYGWLGAEVPGAGLLRDGARVLVLAAPLLVVLVGHAVAALAGRLPAVTAAQVGIAVAAALLPVALLPDLAGGMSGRLQPVAHPASHDLARAAVRGAEPDTEVLLLPLTSYRAPEWNHGRKVLDPLGRHLGCDHVASDELVVDGTVVAGEDPRVRAARSALAAAGPQERAARLADLGIGAVVVDREAPGADRLPRIGGRPVLEEPDLHVLLLEGAEAPSVPVREAVLVGLAWAAYVGLLVAAGACGLRAGIRARRGSR